MKKLILVSFLLVATLVVQAQRGGGNPEARAQKQVERLTEQLNLSADQQTQLYDLFLDRTQNRKANGKRMRDLSQEERDALKADRKAAKADFDNQIGAILTPEQFETFQNLPKGRRGKGKGKGAEGKRGGKGKGKANKGERGGQGRYGGRGGKAKGKGTKADRQKATPTERAQKQTDRLTEQLGLDADQQAAVYDLHLNRANNRKGQDWKNLILMLK